MTVALFLAVAFPFLVGVVELVNRAYDARLERQRRRSRIGLRGDRLVLP